MRELKFRAWNKKTKQIVDLHKTTPLALSIKPEMAGAGLGVYIPDHPDLEVMQFTGLKAKGDKEIYEGDKVSFTVFDYNGHDTQYEGVIVYAGSRFMIWQSKDNEYYGGDGGFDLDWVVAQDEEIEVIGNIYEQSL